MSEKIKVESTDTDPNGQRVWHVVHVGDDSVQWGNYQDAKACHALCLAAHALGVAEERARCNALAPVSITTLSIDGERVTVNGVEYRRVDSEERKRLEDEIRRAMDANKGVEMGRATEHFAATAPPSPAWKPPTKAETRDIFLAWALTRSSRPFADAWCGLFKPPEPFSEPDDALALQMAIERSV